MEYLIILMALLLITIVLERKFKIHLYKSFKQRLFTVTLFCVIGIIWDSYAIWRGDWVFPEGKNLGIIIGFMPLEEYLFILIVPYSVITIYKIIDSKLSQSKIEIKSTCV
jgi:lycopene cyclase domain-containing protein